MSTFSTFLWNMNQYIFVQSTEVSELNQPLLHAIGQQKCPFVCGNVSIWRRWKDGFSTLKTIQGNNTITTLTSSPPTPSPTILALLRWGNFSKQRIWKSGAMSVPYNVWILDIHNIFMSKSIYIYIFSIYTHIVPHSFQLCPVCCISRSPNKEHYSNLILPVMFALANRFLTRRVMRIQRFKYVPNLRGNQMLVLVR